ncbi:MAG: ATP-binding protein [Cyanobacteria bacterium P01_A01_bin.123]
MKNKGFPTLQPIQTGHFRTKTDLKDLDRVLEWFEQFQSSHESRIPENIWLQCQLALVEGFTNAVRHAHRQAPPETPIDIEVTLFTDRLEINIWDRGPGFDMGTWLKRMPKVVDKNSEGGRGVRLIAKIADQMRYTSEADGRNRLYMSKRY